MVGLRCRGVWPQHCSTLTQILDTASPQAGPAAGLVCRYHKTHAESFNKFDSSIIRKMVMIVPSAPSLNCWSGAWLWNQIIWRQEWKYNGQASKLKHELYQSDLAQELHAEARSDFTLLMYWYIHTVDSERFPHSWYHHALHNTAPHWGTQNMEEASHTLHARQASNDPYSL